MRRITKGKIMMTTCYHKKLKTLDFIGFEFNQVLKLTGLSSWQLRTVVSLNWIIPIKLSESKNGKLLFSWEQLIELKAIAKLRKKISFQKMINLKDVLLKLDHESFKDDSSKVLVATDKTVFLIDKSDVNYPTMMELLGVNCGQYVLAVFPISEMIKEIEETAKQNNIAYLPQKEYSQNCLKTA